MADLIDRPGSAVTPVTRAITPAPSAEVAVDKLLTTRSPQRPQRSPTFYVEIDGQKLEAFEGQTILEVCRANGIEVPTLCYDPKLPGFGACRMCVVDVEGCDQPSI
ncbi:MAG: 2Fe-2S iron-sulfur cluster-binding protein, partial [Candidatus Limnocylindrus sp.]